MSGWMHVFVADVGGVDRVRQINTQLSIKSTKHILAEKIWIFRRRTQTKFIVK